MNAPKPSVESSANRNPLPIDLEALVLAELEAAQKRGIPIKAIAFDAGMAPSRLYEINERRKRLAFDEADDFMRAVRSTRLLDGLARNVGAIVVFVRPVAAEGHDDIHEAFEAAVEDLAEISRETRESIKDDGVIDPAEATHIVARIEKAQGSLEAYKRLVYDKTVRTPPLRAVAR